MTFQIQNFARVSVSANEDITDIQSTIAKDSETQQRLIIDTQGCFRKHHYFSKVRNLPGSATNPATVIGDNQATIATPGYFDAIVNDLQQYDLIEVYSAFDGSRATYMVTALNSTTPKVSVSLLNSNNLASKLFVRADILGMYTAPVVVIPAVAGSIIVVDSAIFKSSAGTAYGDGGVIFLQYGNTANGGGTKATGTAAATLLTTANGAMIANVTRSTAPALANTVDSLGVYITNATGVFTGAAVTQQLGLYVTYSIYPSLSVAALA